MFKQILPANAIRNVWRTVRRICMLILELKGLTFHWYPLIHLDREIKFLVLKKKKTNKRKKTQYKDTLNQKPLFLIFKKFSILSNRAEAGSICVKILLLDLNV